MTETCSTRVPPQKAIMQTNPEQWADDVRYLAKLADWAASQGFCQIEGLTDPDEWCALKWDALNPDANGTGYGYSADALAAALIASIQAAFAEREVRLVGALNDVGASLTAAISLLERGGKAAKKAAPSDRMFDQMLKDYSASLERALAALKDRTDG